MIVFPQNPFPIERWDEILVNGEKSDVELEIQHCVADAFSQIAAFFERVAETRKWGDPLPLDEIRNKVEDTLEREEKKLSRQLDQVQFDVHVRDIKELCMFNQGVSEEISFNEETVLGSKELNALWLKKRLFENKEKSIEHVLEITKSQVARDLIERFSKTFEDSEGAEAYLLHKLKADFPIEGFIPRPQDGDMLSDEEVGKVRDLMKEILNDPLNLSKELTTDLEATERSPLTQDIWKKELLRRRLLKGDSKEEVKQRLAETTLNILKNQRQKQDRSIQAAEEINPPALPESSERK